MALGTLEKRVYLKLRDGKVHATEPPDSTYDYFEGHLAAVTTREQDFKGEVKLVVNLHFRDGVRDYVLGMTATTGLCRSILSSLCNAEPLGVVRIRPYMHGEWQRAVVENNGQRLEWKYKTNEMDPLELVDRMIREIRYKLEQQAAATVTAAGAPTGSAPAAPAPVAPPVQIDTEDAVLENAREQARGGEPDGLPF